MPDASKQDKEDAKKENEDGRGTVKQRTEGTNDQAATGAGDERCVDEEPSTATKSEHASDINKQEVANEQKIDPEDALKCEGEINDIHKVINAQEAEFDKQLLTLCSALIALSLAFAKDVAPLGPTVVPLLTVGLILLVCCVVSVLCSVQISIRGQEKAKDYWTLRREDTWGKHSFPMWYARCIKIANSTSCILFIAGLICVGSFVLINVNREIKMSKKNSEPLPAKFNDAQSLKIPVDPRRNDSAGSTIKTNPSPPPEKKK